MQIFFAKLGMNSGAAAVSFQVLSTVVAFGILAIVIYPSIRSDFWHLFHKQRSLFWQLYLANGIQAGLGTSFALIGIALTEAINAGFLVKLTTVTTIIFAWFVLKEKITLFKVVTILLMLLGAFLLTTAGQIISPRPGDILLLAACICWSLGSVLVRRFLKDRPIRPDTVTMQKPLASFPVLFVLIGLSYHYTLSSPESLPLLSCCSISSMDLFFAFLNGSCLAIAWIFLYRTLKVSTASYLTLMSMLTPVLVSLLAIVFLGESLVWMQLLGALLIICSGILVYYSDMAYT